jgi:hypothetical protein
MRLNLILLDLAIATNTPLHHSILLHRVLALRIELQNALFEEFEVRLESKIEEAIAAGTYEVGVETLKADSFRVLERKAIYTHPQTKAPTHCVKIERKRKAEVLSLSEALDMAERYQGKLVVNERSGRVAIAVPTNSTVTDDGAIDHAPGQLNPPHKQREGECRAIPRLYLAGSRSRKVPKAVAAGGGQGSRIRGGFVLLDCRLVAPHLESPGGSGYAGISPAN